MASQLCNCQPPSCMVRGVQWLVIRHLEVRICYLLTREVARAEVCTVYRLLFLCTGNYYRSRFAELLFNALAPAHDLPWQAFSRGVALEAGVRNVGPISPLVLHALQALGIDSAEPARYPMQVQELVWTSLILWAISRLTTSSPITRVISKRSTCSSKRFTRSEASM